METTVAKKSENKNSGTFVDPKSNQVADDTVTEPAPMVSEKSIEPVTGNSAKAVDQTIGKNDLPWDSPAVTEIEKKEPQAKTNEQGQTNGHVPDKPLEEQSITSLEVKEVDTNGKDTEHTVDSVENLENGKHTLLNESAAVITTSSDQTQDKVEIQETGAQDDFRHNDDDAASVASSAHSEAYESAGEAPETEEASDSKTSQDFAQDIESPEDLDYTDNTVTVDPENIVTIGPNTLTPREQEKAGMCNTLVALPRNMTKYLSMTSDELMKEGIEAFFSNKFMKAKSVFKTKSDSDPLFALGLGSMAFIKAIMTYDPVDIDVAMNVLSTTCAIAKAQIDAASAKRPFKEAFSHYFSSIITQSRTGLPDTPKSNPDEPKTFLPNGVLRAHVVKAEGSLLIGMLHLCQENVTGYLKCGLSIRRGMYHAHAGRLS